MADAAEKNNDAVGNTSSDQDLGNVNLDGDLDERIEKYRKVHAAKAKEGGDDSGKTDTSNQDDENRKKLSDDEIAVKTSYIHKLREENKSKRLEAEKLQQDMSGLKDLMKTYFQVDSPQALKEKLEKERREREESEEGRLSKLEFMEKKLKDAERVIEESRIKHEQRERDLEGTRDKIIIQNALIQEAVANDVANPKQLLKLLESEFHVDPKSLVPYYKAEEGAISLSDRVKMFLEEPDNWNLVRSRITGGGGSHGATGASGKRTFTRQELSEMRRTKPKEYVRLADEIASAYKEGRVSR